MSMPKHVAIIMDGNGRWATQQGLPRVAGHRKGADVVRAITTHACKLGIEFLTLYSFSAQNWKRPPDEIASLMGLLEEFCASELHTLQKNNVRFQTIGRLERLPASTRLAVQNLIQATQHHTGMCLTLALDYGGREEIVDAVKALHQDLTGQGIDVSTLSEEVFAQYLYTAHMPDPDVLIRTSGEERISNFLLWQIAYAELVFVSRYWPDFTSDDFDRALGLFAQRERRFGSTEKVALC